MKNRREGVRTRSSCKKHKAGTGDGGSPPISGNSHLDNPFEEEFGSSSDSGQGVWMELSEGVASDLANTVVSLASFDEGNSMFFACTGIIIKNDPETKTTSFLTSLSLVRSIEDDTKIFHDMKVQVCLPDNTVELGWLNFWDLQHNLALINIPRFHTLQVACLDNQQQFECHSKVVAVGRCFNSGKLMATAGMLTHNLSGDYREELAISTCEITMTGVGGPLINFDGDFIGMNFHAEKETPFLPRNKILQLLKQFSETIPSWSTCGIMKRSPIPRKSQGSSRGGQINKGQKPSICTLCDPDCQPGLEHKILNCKRFHAQWPDSSDLGYAENFDLQSRRYPFPLWEDFGRRLVNSFEEEFSENISSKLKKKVSSKMSQCVVALASFIGKERCFACTGVIIGSNDTTRVLTSASLLITSDNGNKVDDKLKIVVCLPDNRHISGTLQHFSPNYNIAVIGIRDFHCTRTARMDDQVQIKPHGEVVAIGRVYNSGKLMATSGVVTDKPSKLSCKELAISTCKITKAGIGGPLIDFAGNFIGMNFYGSEETPYIPKNIILELLRNFDAKGLCHVAKCYGSTIILEKTDSVAMEDHSPNRWPVPKPFWCYPTWHKSEEEEEIDVDELLAKVYVLY